MDDFDDCYVDFDDSDDDNLWNNDDGFDSDEESDLGSRAYKRRKINESSLDALSGHTVGIRAAPTPCSDDPFHGAPEPPTVSIFNLALERCSWLLASSGSGGSMNYLLLGLLPGLGPQRPIFFIIG